MTLDGAGGVDHRFQPAVGGPEIPLLEEAGLRLSARLIVEILKGKPDLVGPCGLEMARGKAVECRPLPIRQAGWIAQPEIACAAQQALPLLLGAAHLIDGVVDDLDGMELVKGDGSFGQVLG